MLPLISFDLGAFAPARYDYCETHKTVNTRNIYGLLLCCEELANETREN